MDLRWEWRWEQIEKWEQIGNERIGLEENELMQLEIGLAWCVGGRAVGGRGTEEKG